MDRDPATILDLVLFGRRLTRFVEGRTRDDLDNDLLLRSAVLYTIAIIGEATTRLSSAFREAHPDIPWGEIVGTRNRIIHCYDQIKLDVVWSIANEKISLVLLELEPLVPPPPETNP